ncbi:PadR family transcriptional regulator [Sediminibacillus massiliensis]|uniref:PadR family transcriptional regulator n=1 Tax=Sediminibacillus massiliensis TaxID=1926277 RepID=UPI0009887A86|nr:PadR family transcriptional regulator [Sediminibacillus massiliensis]
MNIQFKKGALELCVLVMIDSKDQYGYELAQNISKHIQIAEGTLYPMLRRLTKEEYLTTYFTPSKEGPSRKYYSLTQKGRIYKNELIKEWNAFTIAVNQLIEEEMDRG